jgi:hypothetical protein
MPKNAQVDQFREWENLLKEVGVSKAELAGVVPFQAALENAYAQAVSARFRRDALRASTRESTAQVVASLAACTEAARSLRHFLKGVLGSRNKKLTRYGIQPLCKRSR